MYKINNDDWYIIENKYWLQASFTDEDIALAVTFEVDYLTESYRFFAYSFADDKAINKGNFDIPNDRDFVEYTFYNFYDYDDIFTRKGKLRPVVIPQKVIDFCLEECQRADAEAEIEFQKWLDEQQ